MRIKAYRILSIEWENWNGKCNNIQNHRNWNRNPSFGSRYHGHQEQKDQQVGLGIIGLSVISKEQIGKGDGLVIAAVGIAFGARRCFLVLSTASFVMCVIAIGVLLLKKGGRQTRLPFLPALFAGYVLCVVL